MTIIGGSKPKNKKTLRKEIQHDFLLSKPFKRRKI